MDKPVVGIDAMAFAGPECFVEMAALADARGVDPNKYIKGIGQRQMAVATPCEDTVTLAAEAGRKALEAFGIDPAEIGTLVVGTETGVDHSKPSAVYVHELLGLPARCRTFETKHACYGAMAGLTAAMDWILSGRAKGRKALIIASDIARYGVNTPGEPTQGAGAVAMVISENPRLLALDADLSGDFTKQVMDFWRPLYSKYAQVDGHYSIDCYLEALEGCLDHASEQLSEDANQGKPFQIGELDACLYHVPFTKMAKKAHHRHRETELGDRVSREDPRMADILGSYGAKVSPFLSLNERVGNIYTGSVFLAMIDFLRQLGPEHAGQRLSLFSYGSGSGAALMFAEVVQGAGDWSATLDPTAELDARRALSIADYEALCAASEEADLNNSEMADPARWGLGSGLFYTGTVDHQRRYARIG
ncbi:MAG: hydroxymethylglutaryl-CoA synthase [Myxococcota bacterium]|nr:hydroxymethylglutaryl-CoA synthase [Myxococcota bacterium]